MLKFTLNDIKNHKDLKELIKKYNIDDQILQNNILVINRFLNDYVYCEKEEEIKYCKQSIPGVQQKLVYKNNLFYIASKNCKHWTFQNKDYKILRNIIYADYDLKENTQTMGEYIESLDLNKLNQESKTLFTKIRENMVNNSFKGLYLYGAPGIGKTFLMKRLANTYARKDKKVIFVTVNKLVKIVKDTFNQLEKTELSKFYDDCLKVDILILDDIGAEIVSDWSRDELLFGILNHRLENKCITYFTSNFSIADLQKYYLNKKVIGPEQKKFELQKTLRFTERIKGLTNEFEMTGENKRY
ncbi:ATP-binding protein [Spiroplasma floricola]|uniref:Primosomal protein DnaI n=1 Tax=Spiroplasma floricola 23-6 TaxID=1336749 RepID=A0A2K8SES5_9MOLU|nr:ATP-binding protein [Spiroplasma floricola]AUB31967.1 primosomal protein DnaI [Spiroplasma floricola 23-6]